MNRLNGFEKQIKDGLENFEMPFDDAAWSAMEQKLDASAGDAFESMLRKKVENHESPFDATQWTRLERSLPKKGISYRPWVIAASLVGVIGGSILIYNLNTESADENKTEIGRLEKNIISENSIIDHAIDNKETSDNSKVVNGMNVETTSTSKTSSSVKENNVLAEEVKSNTEKSGTTEKESNKENGRTETSKTTVESNTKENNSVSKEIVTATEITLPQPLFSISNDEICTGQEVSFTASNIPVAANCVWEVNHNGAAIKTAKQFTYVFADPGSYTISLHFQNEKGQSAATTKTVVVKPSPQLTLQMEKVNENGRPFYHFSTRSSDVSSVNWTFHDGTVSTEAEPVKFYRHKGDYKLTVDASSANGCQVRIVKSVHVDEDYNLFAPNAFSPNGDNLNNVFIPSALLVLNVDFVMNIYTREGKLVYQTTSVDRPWDGRYMSDNQPAPMGAYIWVVQIKGEDTYKGTVTLIRD
ncbi:MAG TPA: PKD domain-containing protein [Flavobacteriales bacterium]|nr:PKD domain-containing protein [Flavobacteriales bacterium]HRJ37740.1 PKD domain-containing protein [Flavobacteriales bacterium]